MNPMPITEPAPVANLAAGATEPVAENSIQPRRDLLRTAALIAGGAIASTVAGNAGLKTAHAQDAAPAASAPTPSPAPGELELLNFALGLEYLEQAFYSAALNADSKIPYLGNELRAVVTTISDHENAHVQAITAAIAQLGGTPASRPPFQFPPEAFISRVAFARFAIALEDIGIGAYLGAVDKIPRGPLRTAAASIYGAETRHISVLRLISGYTFSERYYEGPLTVEQVRSLIAPYMAA